MNRKQLLFFIFIFTLFHSAGAQVIKNSVINLNILTNDSQRVNSKSSLALIMLNYQTGEATVKVKAESFNIPDTNICKAFQQKSNDIEMHFIVSKPLLDMLANDNKEHSGESAGMLYLNNHFTNVQISYSMYNKNGNTVDYANNNVFFSFQCNFKPEDFQLDKLATLTNEPILLWSSKQAVNFMNTN